MASESLELHRRTSVTRASRPPSLETAVKGPGGTLALVAKTSKAGRSYYAIVWHWAGSPREAMVPVFSNEISWVLGSLDTLATDVSLDRISEDGTYPIASCINVSGGVAWDAECDEGTVTLSFRRFNTSIWKKEESFYTRYFVPARMGRIPQKAAIPRRFLEDGAFEEFVEEVRVRRDRVRDYLLGTLYPLPEGEFDPFRQAVLGGKLADYTTESLSQAICLKRPVPRICLDLCEDEQSARELSDLLPLHAKEIARVLGWTQRYDPIVLASAFFFSPRTEKTGETFLAVRQPDLFRCDPLLSCLDPENPPRKGDDEDEVWVRAPQCKVTSFQKAIDSGLANGFFSTTWGRAPIPEEEEADKARRFVRMHSSMRKHRYKILQLAWRASAEINNFPGGVSRDPVLCFQRMALLRRDVEYFFENEQGHLQQKMRERMNAPLAGDASAISTNEWEDLPKKGEG